MFKTITVIKIADRSTKDFLNSDIFVERVNGMTVRDPDSTQWKFAGFFKPSSFGETIVFKSSAANALGYVSLIDIQVRERVLPGKVIRKALAEMIADIENRQGRRCGRKEIAELKDIVIASLLPSSHIKPNDTLSMIIGDYLMIGSASANVVDTVLQLIRKTRPEAPLQFELITKKRHVGPFLHRLLVEGYSKSEQFTAGTSVVLKGENKSTVRVKDMSLDSEAVLDHVKNGMSPVELGIAYTDKLAFVLTENLILRRIRISDILIEQVNEAEGEVTYFDATTAIVASALLEVVNTLLDEIPADGEPDDDGEL